MILTFVSSNPTCRAMIFVRKDSDRQKSLKKFQKQYVLELFLLFLINF